MLFLPGIVLSKQVNSVTRGLDKLGVTVRGLYGEGSEAYGNMFQVSNQSTLGESERQIIAKIEQVVEYLLEHERKARYTLLESKPNQLYDYVGRAYGLLCHAYVLTSEEALNSLSALRLGIDLGMFSSLKVSTINELMIKIQPGHLQKNCRREISSGERDVYRAGIVKKHII